jgi:ubiquinone/menaquinone biosynthesis C-methylase UbiE
MIQRDLSQAARMVESGNPWYTVDQYKSHLEGVYRYSTRHRFDYVRRLLNGVDTAHDHLAGRTLLDLGCGDGVWSILIQRHFRCQFIGIDYNELRLKRYQANVPGAVTRLGSCYDIPMNDHSADLILFNQVLEHLERPADALHEIRRVLRPGGYLILSVPNEGTWLKQTIQYRFIQPKLLQSTDHLQFFTRPSLASLLTTCGFAVDRVDLVGFQFPHNGISRRLVSRRWTYEIGLGLAHLFPVLHDCIFALAHTEGQGPTARVS